MCSAGCPNPGTHQSWGDCIRAKNVQIESPEARKFATDQNRVIEDYVDARRSGIQPESVTASAVAQAREITDKTGVPFRADNL